MFLNSVVACLLEGNMRAIRRHLQLVTFVYQNKSGQGNRLDYGLSYHQALFGSRIYYAASKLMMVGEVEALVR